MLINLHTTLMQHWKKFTCWLEKNTFTCMPTCMPDCMFSVCYVIVVLYGYETGLEGDIPGVRIEEW